MTANQQQAARFLRCWLFLAAGVGASALVRCGPQQNVVVIDTDAPVFAQLANHPELSPDAALDAVRVDVLGEHGELLDICQMAAPDPKDWPVSFGIAPGNDYGGPFRLRVRGFQQKLARSTRITGFRSRCGQPVSAETGISVSEPLPEATIDRVVDLPPFGLGKQYLLVRLSLDCMGAPASFLQGTTCIDGTSLAAPFTTSPITVSEAEAGTSVMGTSPLAHETDCRIPPPAGIDPGSVRCIKGGFSLQGDYGLVGVSDLADLDPVPLRAVWVPPYFLDLTEYTVGRLRKTLAAHSGIQAPVLRDPNSTGPGGTQYCTWEPNADPQKPVNCVWWSSARAACRADGGDLPSEAQWEHAARGRGRGRRFPWGADEATCCQASLGRLVAGFGIVPMCPGEGTERVGSHRGVGCPQGGDTSIDGILDMAGSLEEHTRDAFQPYSAHCGQGVGVSRSPVCDLPGNVARVSRGGDWSVGLGAGLGALRLLSVAATLAIGYGFRCAYPGE